MLRRTTVDSWIDELERCILPAPATAQARDAVTRAGVGLLTYLGNHLSQLPNDGVAARDDALRGVRRAWPKIAPPGISRAQTDSVRRLLLGSRANGHPTGRTTGIVQWVAQGHSIAVGSGLDVHGESRSRSRGGR